MSRLKKILGFACTMAAFTPYVYATTLDPSNFLNNGESACMGNTEAQRYLNDFDINPEDFSPIDPNDCGSNFWQLLQTIQLATRYTTGDINVPNSAIKNLPQNLQLAIQKIRFRQTAESDATIADLDFSTDTVTVTQNFLKASPLLRLAYLTHAATHFSNPSLVHQMCLKGPLKGRRSCDETYSPTAQSANANAIQFLAAYFYQGNPTRINPAIQGYARHLANSILSVQFSNPAPHFIK